MRKNAVPLAIGAALAVAAAFAAVALGLFDGAPASRMTAPNHEPPTIAVAPLEEALTFARDGDGRTLAVFSYENGKIAAAPLGIGEDAISLVNRLSYDGAKAMIERLSVRVDVDAAALAIPVDLQSAHIAAGTNYRDHADEADVEGGPFLFPKYVTPTPARSAIPAGDALLDYEVELCLVAMTEIAATDKASGGLILCNDVTDRARLLRAIDPDHPESGDGFTSGKSAEGHLPVGDLFIVPRDLTSFVETLTLQLSVNGAERQNAKATLWIWDFDKILEEARAKRGLAWDYWGGTARLPFDEAGALPARTMIFRRDAGRHRLQGNPPKRLRARPRPLVRRRTKRPGRRESHRSAHQRRQSARRVSEARRSRDDRG